MDPTESKALADALTRIAGLVPALWKLRALDDSTLLAELRRSPGFASAMAQAETDMGLLTQLWNTAAARWNQLASLVDQSEGVRGRSH